MVSFVWFISSKFGFVLLFHSLTILPKFISAFVSLEQSGEIIVELRRREKAVDIIAESLRSLEMKESWSDLLVP